jgi:hypothetical protein
MSDDNVIILMNHEHQIKCGKMIGRRDHGPFVGTILARALRPKHITRHLSI